MDFLQVSNYSKKIQVKGLLDYFLGNKAKLISFEHQEGNLLEVGAKSRVYKTYLFSLAISLFPSGNYQAYSCLKSLAISSLLKKIPFSNKLIFCSFNLPNSADSNINGNIVDWTDAEWELTNMKKVSIDFLAVSLIEYKS